MDNREWETFITVVEEGNMTKAAEKLFISQPALSYRIRQMEAALGNALLLRTAEGIILTPQGEIYHDYCKRMVQEQEKLSEALNAISGKIQGTLKIASSINFADYELPKLLSRFRELYPDINIQVKTAFSQQVVKMVNTGECVIAFARGGHMSTGKTIRLLDEPYCLVYKDLVPHKELLKVPFIRYDTDGTVSGVIETWCTEHLEKEPAVAMDVNSMVTCRHFVREGLGWSILTYMGLGSCKDKDIFVSPIRDKAGNLVTRETNLIYNEEAINLVVVKTFVDYVLDYYAEHNIVDPSIFEEYSE